MCLNSRLCCFLVGVFFVFFGCGRRRETHFLFFRVPSSSCLQTEISHADRDFSLALAVLHAVDKASLALQHTNVRGEGLFHSAPLKDCWLVALPSLLFSFLACSLSGCFFWLRPSTGPVAWVPFGRVGWSLRRKKKTHETRREDSAMEENPKFTKDFPPLPNPLKPWKITLRSAKNSLFIL